MLTSHLFCLLTSSPLFTLTIHKSMDSRWRLRGYRMGYRYCDHRAQVTFHVSPIGYKLGRTWNLSPSSLVPIEWVPGALLAPKLKYKLWNAIWLEFIQFLTSWCTFDCVQTLPPSLLQILLLLPAYIFISRSLGLKCSPSKTQLQSFFLSQVMLSSSSWLHQLSWFCPHPLSLWRKPFIGIHTLSFIYYQVLLCSLPMVFSTSPSPTLTLAQRTCL